MTAAVMQAYRFALDPPPGQVRNLERHAGAARFTFSWALAAVKGEHWPTGSERSYGLDGPSPRPGVEFAGVASCLERTGPQDTAVIGLVAPRRRPAVR